MIKSYFDSEGLSIRLGMVFAKIGLSPNAWTILALVPAALGLIYLFNGNLLYGLILFIFSGLIDAIDGAVARVTKSVSNLGAFLDGVIDRYVEAALYLGLMAYLWGETLILPSQVWVLLLVYGALMPTFIRAYSDHKGVVSDPEKLRKMGGLLERFERLLLIYLGMFLALLFNEVYLMYLIVLVTILANLTAAQRIYYVIKEA